MATNRWNNGGQKRHIIGAAEMVPPAPIPTWPPATPLETLRYRLSSLQAHSPDAVQEVARMWPISEAADGTQRPLPFFGEAAGELHSYTPAELSAISLAIGWAERDSQAPFTPEPALTGPTPAQQRIRR